MACSVSDTQETSYLSNHHSISSACERVPEHFVGNLHGVFGSDEHILIQ